LDQQTAQYAIRKRDVYVLEPGNKHATNLSIRGWHSSIPVVYY